MTMFWLKINSNFSVKKVMEKQENKELLLISINGARIQPAILTPNSKSLENYKQMF